MAELAPPPLWFRAGRALARRLPAGRFRAFALLRRGMRRPFRDRLGPEAAGAAYRCDLRNLIACELCLTGRYAPAETAVVRASLRPGGTFVDVGANLGYFTLVAAAAVGPHGRVLALEPHPELAAELRENLAANGLDQVEVREVAAAETPARLELSGFAIGGNWGSASLVNPAADGAPRFTVDARPLDALLAEAGLDAVDLVKLDVEGAEERVLRGMAAGLAAHRYRRVLLELHPGQVHAPDELPARIGALLRPHGYRGWWFATGPEAERAALYRRGEAGPRLLPLEDDAQPLSAWPHQLWTLPGDDPRATTG